MNKYSYDKETKGKNILIKVLIMLFILIGMISVFFTNYKTETLICSKSDDVCFIQKINLLNMKSKKNLLKFSQIDKVSYMPQKVKGNRFAKGYTSYLLTFYTKENNPVVIFSTAYFDKDEIKSAVKNVNKQIKNNENFVKYDR